MRQHVNPRKPFRNSGLAVYARRSNDEQKTAEESIYGQDWVYKFALFNKETQLASELSFKVHSPTHHGQQEQ